MDPSQKAAEPTAPVAVATLIKSLKPAASHEAEGMAENREAAAYELSMISELQGSAAFQWFERLFITGPYDAERQKMLAEHLPADEDGATLRARFTALKQVRIGMLSRELHHRELINPNDEQVARLREKLALL